MAFTFQQAATGSATGTSLAVTFANAPVSGELIVITVATNSSTATVTPPSGFSTKVSNSNTSRSIGIYYKVAGSGEPTSYTTNFSASVTCAIVARRFSSDHGWNTTQTSGASNYTWDSGTVSSVSTTMTTVAGRLIIGDGYSTNTTSTNKQLNPNSNWLDNTLLYSNRTRSAYRAALGGSETFGYQLSDAATDTRMAVMVAEFVEYTTKNGNNSTKSLTTSWNGRKYSDSSKAPSFLSPNSLSATPAGSSLSVSFTDRTSGWASHKVYYSSDSGSSWSSPVTKSAGVTSHTFTGLANGTYLVKVVATFGGTDASESGTTASGTISGSSWQLSAGHYESSKIAMEIIAPRAGLTTANRYYKQYPGIPYRVPVAVLGGAWPFKYELTTAPSGMTIGSVYGDTDYGVIVWSNPTTSGSPYTVAVKVTDQEGTICTVSYTLTVSTSGHLFIDAVNGNDSNAGTLASPKKTVNGWYVAYTDTTYQNYFVWYRAGTYRIDAANDTGGASEFWSRCFGDRKPDVHIAYPSETAIFDATNRHFCFSNTVAPTIIGFTVSNIAAGGTRGFAWWDSAPGALIFENRINPTVAAGVSGQNPSAFMSRRNVISQYAAMIGNTFDGMNAHQNFLMYDTDKTVIENNNQINATGDDFGHGFFFKETNKRASVRNNRGLTGNQTKLVHITPTGTLANDIEVCWNNFRSSYHGIHLGQATDIPIVNFWDYRNTWVVPYNEWAVAYGSTAYGNWESQKNVIQHNGSHTNGIYVNTSEGGGANLAGTITQDNLTGTSGIVDSSGLLTGSNRTTYLGVRGCEVA